MSLGLETITKLAKQAEILSYQKLIAQYSEVIQNALNQYGEQLWSSAVVGFVLYMIRHFSKKENNETIDPPIKRKRFIKEYKQYLSEDDIKILKNKDISDQFKITLILVPLVQQKFPRPLWEEELETWDGARDDSIKITQDEKTYTKYFSSPGLEEDNNGELVRKSFSMVLKDESWDIVFSFESKDGSVVIIWQENFWLFLSLMR